MSWFVPALKAILPHLGTIVSTAAPVFTRRRDEQAVAQQIAELQNASARNAENIRELAMQLQSALATLEQSAAAIQRRLRWLTLACGVAATVAVVALVMVIGRAG